MIFFINLRNKHISHPVSILEIGKVGIKLSPPAKQEKLFLGLIMGRYSRCLESDKTLCTFVNLCNEVLGYLERNINIEGKKLEEWVAKQKIEELYNLPYLSFPIPATNLRKERKQKMKTKVSSNKR